MPVAEHRVVERAVGVLFDPCQYRLDSRDLYEDSD